MRKKCKALVLSCIDFRFVNVTKDALLVEYDDDYDLLTIGGASLCCTHDITHNKEITNMLSDFWQTVMQNINIAVKLHSIKEVVIIDHRDCGAYKQFYSHVYMNSEEENLFHTKNCNAMKYKIKDIWPQLVVKTYLIDLNGEVEMLG